MNLVSHSTPMFSLLETIIASTEIEVELPFVYVLGYARRSTSAGFSYFHNYESMSSAHLLRESVLSR